MNLYKPLLCFFLTCFASRPLIALTNPKPNIIVFYIDDMGSVDLGCYGNTFNLTPHIDRLAGIGVRFNAAYSACTVCSPSRAALMTGKYPEQLHITDWIAGHEKKNPKLLIPDWRKYLPVEEKTIAEYLHTAGYATWHVGKWHLGEGDEYLPTHQGFDVNVAGSNWGHPHEGYFSPYHMPNLTDGPSGEYLTDRLTDEAIRLIKNHSSSAPFYLNFAHYGVHTPLQAKGDKVDKYNQLLQVKDSQKNPTYAAMIESVDESVAKIIQQLEKQQLLDNTLIIFAADNGTLMTTATSKPFRKGKGWSYEGGTRTPLIVYWKNHFDHRAAQNVPIITMDLTATMMIAAGLKIPKYMHGKDLQSLMRDKKSMDRPLFWHYPHYHAGDNPYGAVRKGDWKLIEFYENHSFELYNLKNDIGETTNLASTEPLRLKELKHLLSDWRIRMDAQMPAPNPDYKAN